MDEVRDQQNSDVGRAATTLCLVPETVPGEVVATLEQHFATAPVEVVVTQGRRRERRSGRDRRDEETASRVRDRRFAADLEGRRFAERRGGFEPVDPPILPSPASAYAKQLRFVRPRPRSIDDGELTRLRRLLDSWRERARDREEESRELVETLVETMDELRSSRTLSPRRLLALRHGEEVIAQYRDRHVAP